MKGKSFHQHSFLRRERNVTQHIGGSRQWTRSGSEGLEYEGLDLIIEKYLEWMVKFEKQRILNSICCM